MSLIILSEDKAVPTRVQLMRVGEFNYQGEKLSITKDLLKSLLKNFDEKVRGYEDGHLPIDYFHENQKLAGGWIQKLSIEKDGTELWADVKWTTKAQAAIADGELRYLSAEFHFDYESNESGKRFGPTLFGAGLTNVPFIKAMKPVKKLAEGATMTPEEKLAAVEKKLAEAQAEKENQAEELARMKKQVADDAKKAEQAKVLAEKTAAFDKMMKDGKAVEAQREAFNAGDMVKFAELAQPINLSAKGSSSEGEEDEEGKKKAASGKDASDQVLELAEKMVSDNKEMPFSKAVSKVLSENPKLREGYNKSQDWDKSQYA